MIVIEGTVRVADIEGARAHMEAMIAASRAEAGCIDYAYAIDVLDPHLVRVSERWESREALAAHLAAPHLKAWRADWSKFGVGERSLRLYEAEPEAL
jgi:quinol monooxygenase YgiN